MPETPVLMVQGTASGVGKSLIVTGLCRLLHQMGHRVAPFKAQNMSNNSFVTADGYEIARSTAVQAEAACIEPTQYMNPLLLKPEADSSSQVVVLGRPIGSLSARGYYRRKLDLWPTVTEALARLRGDFDVNSRRRRRQPSRDQSPRTRRGEHASRPSCRGVGIVGRRY